MISDHENLLDLFGQNVLGGGNMFYYVLLVQKETSIYSTSINCLLSEKLPTGRNGVIFFKAPV